MTAPQDDRELQESSTYPRFSENSPKLCHRNQVLWHACQVSGKSITDTDNSGRKPPDSGVEDRHPDQSLENAEQENLETHCDCQTQRGCHDICRIVVLSLEMGKKQSGTRLATQEKEAYHKTKEVQEGQQAGALRAGRPGSVTMLPNSGAVSKGGHVMKELMTGSR